MKSSDIKINDFYRILFGEAPVEFLVEVCARAFLAYIILIVAMRLMGKKMASQLSRNELVALVSLSAATGVPIQAPDRGLLPAVIIAVVVVCFQRMVATRSTKDRKHESMVHGKYDTLVADGVINLKCLEKVKVAKERLFAELRSNGIYQLGEVKRLYLEASGTFTLIRETKRIPGLSIIPEKDLEFRHSQKKVESYCVCGHCGKYRSVTNSHFTCKECGNIEWKEAFA